ncbi:MAG: 4Fe-4S dicluster domain-containing protein [candidate division Zixibacteria bacterium]|jgi:Fe-S-cluster-containing hydrogenase component 2|nr:4Fe-4S dicluster domain-containing protein [candidate division Zixibacteria bacterium]
MTHRFVVKPELCIGCRTCELACSFAHARDGKQGRTRIFALGGGFKDLFIPVTCLQCEDPACAKSCLVGAIARNPETGAMEINQAKCVKCMACIAACPFGCSLFDEPQGLVVKCDLCGGDPACAKFCPTKALEYKPLTATALRPAI